MSNESPISRSYRICTRCVMDTTDPLIEFDDAGICSHCRSYAVDAQAFPTSAAEKESKLRQIVREIREAGRDRSYDCVIGVSGGVDSTYVAYEVKRLGLRPLAVHFDNGWNSELAVKNIENIVKKLGIDLQTYVMDWEEFRDLQLAFLKASVPDAEIPTDHGIMATLLRTAVREKVRFIISGTNHATEGILPIDYSYGVSDWRYIRGVHRKFGTLPLRTFPHFSLAGRVYNVFVRKIRSVGILNYLRYEKSDAIATIERELGWKNYGGKHYESIYTRFYQGCILPEKFGIDKRRAHLSSLILSGQVTREHALEELRKPPYGDARLLEEDRQFVVKKFGLTADEFERIWRLPRKRFTDYPTYYPFLLKTRGLVRWSKERGLLPKRVGL